MSRRPPPHAKTWLYLLEREGGTIKVGITTKPRERMANHSRYVGRNGDGPVIWRHFCTTGPRVLMLEVERAVMQAFARAGQQRFGPSSEDFRGIEREQAKRIAREVALSVRGNFSDYADTRVRFLADRDAWKAFRERLTAPAITTERS